MILFKKSYFKLQVEIFNFMIRYICKTNGIYQFEQFGKYRTLPNNFDKDLRNL